MSGAFAGAVGHHDSRSFHRVDNALISDMRSRKVFDRCCQDAAIVWLVRLERPCRVSCGPRTLSPEASYVSVRCRTHLELVEATPRGGPVRAVRRLTWQTARGDSNAAGGWAARACSSIVGPVRGDAGVTGGAGVGLEAAKGGNFGQAAGVGRRAPDAPGGDDGPAVAGSRRGVSHQQPPPGAPRGPSGTGSRLGRRRGPRRAEKRDRQPLP